MISETEIGRTITRRGTYARLGVGLILLAIILPRDWKFGAFTGVMLLLLALYCAILRKWQTEPGLWMLAGLLTLIYAPSLGLFLYEYWRSHQDLPPGQATPWERLRLSIDTILALIVMAGIVKLAVAVAFENWRRTRPNRT